MIEYQYQKCDHDELVNLIKWLQNMLCLRDWTIILDTKYAVPADFNPQDPEEINGIVNFSRDKMKAVIWIPLIRLMAENTNCFEVCCHEMLHVFFEQQGFEKDEQATGILASILYRLFCKENKIKIAKSKP